MNAHNNIESWVEGYLWLTRVYVTEDSICPSMLGICFPDSKAEVRSKCKAKRDGVE